jgi:glycosyltransferase involved in cell wall biosynthesis
MHICVIGVRGIPDIIGGIEAHCQQLYPELLRLAPDLRVTILIRRGYTLRSVFEYNGAWVRSIWSPYLWGVDTVVHSFLSVLYARFMLSADIVHLHGIGPGFFAPLARLLGMRTIVTHHARDYLRPKWSVWGWGFLRIGEFFTAAFGNAVICVSNAVQAEFLKSFPFAKGRAHVIKNVSALTAVVPEDLSRSLGAFGLMPDGYILAVGRLDAAKAFHDLISAYEQSGIEEKLVIVGSEIGNEYNAREMWRHASDKIIFTGFQTGETLVALYRGAALFVHPSRLEGYGLVVAEALSVERPVMISDIPPHLEFELPPQCYFPAGDVAALAAKLRSGNFGQYRAPLASRPKGDWALVARDHLALYDRVLGRATNCELLSRA